MVNTGMGNASMATKDNYFVLIRIISEHLLLNPSAQCRQKGTFTERSIHVGPQTPFYLLSVPAGRHLLDGN